MRGPPTSSGREVVGAATIPPVGAYVSAFSVTSDRSTASAHSPFDWLRAVQSLQNAAVASRASASLIDCGGARCDGPWVITKGTVAPASTSNSATVVRSLPVSVTGVRSVTMSGPAMARQVASGRRLTHGIVRP